MFNLANRTAYAVKQAKRIARGLATAAPRIGDTKVSMSRLEPTSYINYQRIEDNLNIVRSRYVYQNFLRLVRTILLTMTQAQPSFDALGEDSLRPSG